MYVLLTPLTYIGITVPSYFKLLLTPLTYIGITVLSYFELLSTGSTYIVFDGMVEKPQVSASQNVLQIENQLNIKKVMSKDV